MSASSQAELRKLRNIGPRSAQWLAEAGFTTRAQIEELGAAAVYRRLRARRRVSLNLLWALQGALLDLPFDQLPADIKAALLRELEEQEAN